MNSVFGSEWRKWDFHVHTPYSILNNEYKLEANDAGDFDEYVKTLFTKAIEKDVWAIGITDYFSIDGYKRIRNDYLSNEGKLVSLFPEKDVRSRIKQMLIFPNIELRLVDFVSRGNSNKPIGYHVLFSDELEPSEIEENFLQKLMLTPSPDQQLPLTSRNIKKIGEQIREQNNESGEPYLIGLRHACIDESDILKALRECKSFEGRSIISLPVDEALSSAEWSRSYLPKKVLYEQSSCYMTSSPRTRDWALDKDRISEFGSIKPCIWGSDAHSFERLFEPAEQRYCWVKADLTFEGLMQILCEPADRIAIQRETPEQHDPHRSIESIRFQDENFQTDPVFFNEGLTCIIGGRSTGKSLLLRNIAHSISPSYAASQEKRSSVGELGIASSVEVIWRDGVQSGERKIIYLPQTYLNRTVDDPDSGESSASDLIAGVLEQNKVISEKKSQFDEKRRDINRQFVSLIAAHADCRAKLQGARERLQEHGASELFRKTEEELKKEIAGLQASGNASDEDIKTFSVLKKQYEDDEEALKATMQDRVVLESIVTPVVSEPLFGNVGCYGVLTPEVSQELQKEIKSLNQALANKWNEIIARLDDDCEMREKERSAQLAKTADQLTEMKPKIERSGKLYKAMFGIRCRTS